MLGHDLCLHYHIISVREPRAMLSEKTLYSTRLLARAEKSHNTVIICETWNIIKLQYGYGYGQYAEPYFALSCAI